MSYRSRAKLDQRGRTSASSRHVENINPLAVLISLPFASIQHGFLPKKSQDSKHRLKRNLNR
jgi:hypothetical protein